MFRSLATRRVSPSSMGGAITISRVAYNAARIGPDLPDPLPGDPQHQPGRAQLPADPALGRRPDGLPHRREGPRPAAARVGPGRRDVSRSVFLVLGLMIFVTFQDIFRLVLAPAGSRVASGGIAMGILGDRLIVDGDQYRLRSDGRSVADLVSPARVGRAARGDGRPGCGHAGRRGRRAGTRRAGRRTIAGLAAGPGSPPRPRLERALSEPAWAAVFPRPAHRPAGDVRRAAPGPRLLGRQPRGRPGGRRPGRTRLLGLLARHRPSSRARPGQRRLLVPSRRPASGLLSAGRGRPAAARRARRRRPGLPAPRRRTGTRWP